MQSRSEAQMKTNGVRYLVIVARTELDLYNHLKRAFTGDNKVQVLLDRRQAQRRQRAEPHELERRRVDRRRQRSLEQDLRVYGSVLTRIRQSTLPE